MSRDSALAGGAPLPPKLGPAVWLWPVAAAALAAWPVWRSLFPETPDVGEGWLRLQPLMGLASAILYVVWAAKWRRKVHGLWFTSFAIAVAAVLLIGSARRGDAALVDLNALVIGWLAAPAIFATLVLLHVQRTGADAGCKPSHHTEMLPPLPKLGTLILIAIAATSLAAFFAGQPPGGAAIILGVISPGLILAWSSLSDTARSILAKRQAHFADASTLLSLAGRRRWRLCAPTVLVTDRVKLVSLYPGADMKPGELIGLAAAVTMDEESDIARAIQEFGVSHRIRLPALRQARNDQPASPRQATLANGVVVDLRAADDSLDLSVHAEAVALARSQHRIVMAVVERALDPRVLGVIVFAIAARGGAAEAVRVLRDRDIEPTLVAPPRDAADELALKSLSVPRAADHAAGHETTSILRPAQAATEAGDGLAIVFGAARTSPPTPPAHIIVAREDARALVDLARFADDFRTRTTIVTLLASIPGWVLIAAAFGYVPVTPFLITGVALIGIAVATVTPQVLRLSPVLDREGAED